MLPMTLARCVLFAVALGFAATVAESAQAGPFEDGLAAYERDDYATALQLWRPLAEQGDAVAQFRLAIMYGAGVGVPEDDAEAVRWYRKAAAQGHVDAQYYLGSKYEWGEGVAQDDAEAAKWYRRAAEQGDAGAQYYLGAMYDDGRGVPQDYVLAHMWLNLAAARWAPGWATRDRAVKLRDRVAARMTPAQIAEAQRLAREWKRLREGAATP